MLLAEEAMPEEWGKVLVLSMVKWCLRMKGR
jgi:hypothetical protein